MQDKEDKITAKTAQNCIFDSCWVVARRTFIYAALESKLPFERRATLTGFEREHKAEADEHLTAI